MIWDIVIAACCIGLTIVAMIATLLDHKPHKFLCLGTVIFLIGFSVAYFALHLWLAAWSEVACTLAWLVLLLQKRVK